MKWLLTRRIDYFNGQTVHGEKYLTTKAWMPSQISGVKTLSRGHVKSQHGEKCKSKLSNVVFPRSMANSIPTETSEPSFSKNFCSPSYTPEGRRLRLALLAEIDIEGRCDFNGHFRVLVYFTQCNSL